MVTNASTAVNGDAYVTWSQRPSGSEPPGGLSDPGPVPQGARPAAPPLNRGAGDHRERLPWAPGRGPPAPLILHRGGALLRGVRGPCGSWVHPPMPLAHHH